MEVSQRLAGAPSAAHDGSLVATDADAIVVGAGLAGLVATAELVRQGRRVVLLDQEADSSMGGQAFWSFGGVFMVGTPEQRAFGIYDSRDLAWHELVGRQRVGIERWGIREAMGRSLRRLRCGGNARVAQRARRPLVPMPAWVERGGRLANDHGNSVPRFHITWGTGPALVEPFVLRVRDAAQRGRVTLRFRHRVEGLLSSNGVVDGVQGTVLREATTPRGVASSRERVGKFELRAGAVLVTSGGIGGNLDLVRKAWPSRPVALRESFSSAFPRTSMAACSAWSRPPEGTPSMAIGCGTTPKASRTSTPSGLGTPSASLLGRPLSGSTRSATGFPLRSLSRF